jgi:hypothetical protein
MTQIYFGASTMECPDLSSPGLPSSRLLIYRNGKSLDMWPPLLGRSRSISGLSPLFTGGLTLGYLLTDPTAVGFSRLRSDDSDRFLTCAFSHDFLDVEKSMVQMFSWTLRIYDPDLFTTHKDTERQSGKAFNTLISPTNLTVMCDHRFPDGISSIDQHLFRVKAPNTLASSSYLAVVSDHRSPNRISSVDSILITSSFHALDGIFKKGISMGRFTEGTI